MNKIYFKGLNGIRAIASSLIIIFHIDQFFRLFNLSSLGYHKSGMAEYSVILFFVLSGFLITYLMMAEKQTFGSVGLINFYKRRILRIWPIYYLIIFITLLVLQFKIIPTDSNTFITLTLYSFFLSNIGYSLGYGFITITPLWSVGVEEQFYAFWPLLFNRTKNIFYTLIGFIFIYLTIKICLRYFENDKIYYLFMRSAFDSMAVGGIGAYFLFKKSSVLKYVFNKWIQVSAWLFFVVSILYKPIHIASLFDSEIHSIIYVIIILNVSTNPQSIISLENKVMNFLGKISYGMYVYHMSIIVLLSFIWKKYFYQVSPHWMNYVIVYFLVIGCTIVVSFLSYKYLESYFLSLKPRFSKVASTNESTEK